METRLLKENENDIGLAAEIIRSGGTVVFPTETVYGLGANTFDTDAVKKIFVAKGRPGDNPLIVHISNTDMVSLAACEVPSGAEKLMKAFWPGPLTVILKRSDKVPYEVTAGLETVGLRMPKNDTALNLISAAGVPIAAPSANISGRPSPTAFSHCVEDMNGKVDAIIDGGACDVGVESTVIDMTGEPTIYRPGDITRKQIEDVLGVPVSVVTEAKPDEKPKSPGLKYKHYSPNASVVILRGSIDAARNCVNREIHHGRKCAVILFDEILTEISDGLDENALTISLGNINNPKDAEARLFDALRRCDDENAELVFAPEIPSTDVWAAVRNRLYRAAGNTVCDAETYVYEESENFEQSDNPEQVKKPEQSKKLFMFVCTGNTCRSPMAEGIFNDACRRRNLSCRAVSAGLYVMPGSSVSENSVLVMKDMGIDISGHTPTQLTRELAESADVILTMSSSHKAAVIRGIPSIADRVYTLGEYAENGADISDPFGGTLEIYRHCADEIKKCITEICANIKKED